MGRSEWVGIWVPTITLDDLVGQLGQDKVKTAQTAVQAGKVSSVSVMGDGRGLLGNVNSDHGVVQVLVSAEIGVDQAYCVSGICTCDDIVDCAHMVAVVLDATTKPALVSRALPAGGSGEGAAAPVASAWEAPFRDVVQAARPQRRMNAADRLGLQMDLVRPSVAQSSSVRIRLVPVMKTDQARHRWVRQGVDFYHLMHAPSHEWCFPENQRDAVVALARAASSGAANAGALYGQNGLFVDEIGPLVWELLMRATEVGVELVPGESHTGAILLTSDPGRLDIDLSTTANGDLAVTPLLRWRTQVVPASHVQLLGDPVHGFVSAPPLEPSDDLQVLGTSGAVVLGPVLPHSPPGLSALLRQRRTVTVPSTEVSRFRDTYLPALQRVIDVTSADSSTQIPALAQPLLVACVEAVAQQNLEVTWFFEYDSGDKKTHVELGGLTIAGWRDMHEESAVLDAVVRLLSDHPAAAILVDDNPDVALRSGALDPVGAMAFIQNVLPALRKCDAVEVRVRGELPEYRLNEDGPDISLAVNDSTTRDWFDLHVTVTIDGEIVPLSDLIVALAQGDSHMVLASGTYFSLDNPRLRQLKSLLDEARALPESSADQLRLGMVHAGLWQDLADLGTVTAQSEHWREAVKTLVAAGDVDDTQPPVGLNATLRPYQVQGFRWLRALWRAGLGGVLADDMGLGKTVQALAAILDAHHDGRLQEPVLVVAPTSVVGTWVSEAAKFCPDLTVVALRETERRRGSSVAEAVEGAHIVITSYAVLRIDAASFRTQRWSGLILDEAQFVKNHQAQSYQAARQVVTPFRLAITGTPLENSVMDLWSMLSIAAPGLFPQRQKFTEIYRKPIETHDDTERLGVLRRRLQPFMLRRTKDQVATDLPEKMEQVLVVALEPAHRRAYDRYLQRIRQQVLGLVEDWDRNRVQVLAALTALRQLALAPSLVDEQYASIESSKLEILSSHLHEVVSEGHKVLVFSQFTRFLTMVSERLTQDKIAHVYLDGTTRDRDRVVQEFRDGNADVFLISLKAGGFGLNLTEADYVYVLDPWWNPAAEAQAIDRAHRIGQERPVMVYRLVSEGTVEEKVMALQERKRHLFRQVVGGDALATNALDAADIQALFAE